MAAFQTIVKKSKHGAFYFDIPEKVMKSMKLKPFMAAKMKAEKNHIRIFDFQKTVKIKLDLDRKTINIAKIIMREQGFGSLDETISNAIEKWCDKIEGQKSETTTVYIYPTGFLNSKYLLIDDYEKAMKKVKKPGKKGKKSSVSTAKK